MWVASRDIARQRLERALGSAILLSIEALLEQARGTKDLTLYNHLEKSREILSQHRDGLVRSFSRRYAQYSSPDATQQPSPGAGAEFNLLSGTESIDAATQAHFGKQVRNHSTRELNELERRFQQLNSQAPHTGPMNPVAPEILAQALMSALREFAYQPAHRKHLASVLADQLGPAMRDLYQDLIKHFITQASPSSAPQEDLRMTTPHPQKNEAPVTFARVLPMAEQSGVPTQIQDFLVRKWELVRLALRGPSDATADRQVTEIDALPTLLTSLSPAAWQGDRNKQMQALPTLLGHLKKGLEDSGIGNDVQARFLDGLARCHAYVIQCARQARPVDPEPAVTVNPASPAAKVSPLSRSQVEIALRSLAKDMLIRVHREDGSLAVLQIGWISPNRGLFLLQNPRGERVLTLKAEALGEQIRAGRMTIASNILGKTAMNFAQAAQQAA